MRHQRLAVLLVAGLFIGPVLADRKKAGPCETCSTPAAPAQAPADKPCPASITLPSPHYLKNAEQLCPDQAHAAATQMGIVDVIQWAKEGRGDDVIIHQMRTTGSTYQLSSEDVRLLSSNGVTDRVILEMQNRRPDACPSRRLDPAARLQQLLNESEALRQSRLNGAIGAQLPLKTYSVADLVVPIPPAGSPPTAEKPKTLECELIRKITANVEPQSWSAAGGCGTIEYFPLGLALVINQTPTVHEAVERYLDALRKVSDLHVATELVVVTLSDAWFQKAGLHKAFAHCDGDCPGGATRGVCVKREALHKLLRAAKEAGGVGVLAAPTITMLCGQPGQLRVGQTEHFVTGLTVEAVDGKVVYTPKNESHDLGLDLTLDPTVSPEGKVTVAVCGSLKELGVRPVPMTPVTTPIRPVSTDGNPGESVPFTQFIQEPKVLTRKVGGTVVVSDGGTAILYGGKTTIQETTRQALPFATDVPVLQALFTHEKTEETTNHLLVVVTTHVVKPEGCCSDCDACPKCGTKLAKLLGAYDRACKDGKVEDARRLAIECLAIDPMCFGKK